MVLVRSANALSDDASGVSTDTDLCAWMCVCMYVCVGLTTCESYVLVCVCVSLRVSACQIVRLMALGYRPCAGQGDLSMTPAMVG